MGVNTVHYNTFSLSAAQDVLSLFSFGVWRGRHLPGWVGSGCSLGKTSLGVWHGVPWSPFIGYGSRIGWWLWHGESLECVFLAKMSQVLQFDIGIRYARMGHAFK